VTLSSFVVDLLAPLSARLVPLLGEGELELAEAWGLLALPLPLLVWWLLPAHRDRQLSVRIPFFEHLAGAVRGSPERGAVVRGRNWAQRLLAPFVWLLIVGAVARPQWVEPPVERVESARDLLLAVDLSGSMDTRDFSAPDGSQIDRLEAIKLVLDDFITRRHGDRLGLVVFGDAAHLQVPFTLEHDTCRELLAETQVRMAGPRTMIGDAIGLAIRLFEESESEQKVVVLLTDGADTGSRVPPSKAAEIAAQKGITVHTVAVGDPETGGEDVVDVAALQGIAETTGGRFFLAANTAELAGIYAELDSVEKHDFETLAYRPRRPLFHWPLGAALILLLAYHVLAAATTALGVLRERHA